MKALDKKFIQNSTNNLSDASLIIKLNRDIPKIRALNFLKNIRRRVKYNNLYKILSYDLVDTKEDLHNTIKKQVINKILKIYTYKVLSNLFKKLDKIHKNKNISIYEDFFCKLYDINVQKSKYRFIKEQTLEGEPYLHQGIHFTIKQKPKREEKNNKTIIYRKLLPSFVNYLNRIFIDRKCEIFEKIKNNKKGDKFCD